MNVCDALRQRHSVRAFLSAPVTKEKIVRILDIARQAPSGANTQPWQVAVVSGPKKIELQNQIIEAAQSGAATTKDYAYYPPEWKAPYKMRRTECGKQLYDALGIARQDSERRKDQWIANYRAFDAPIMMLFFIDRSLATGSYMDYGMFLQSIMLAALDEGLATCPQAALAEYPAVVKECLGYPQDIVLVCGLALGYEDTTAVVNSYRTPREEVASFTRFFE